MSSPLDSDHGDRRRFDRQRLKAAFAEALDRSSIDAWIQRTQKERDAGLELLGEGSHFRAWLLPARRQGGPGALRLVLKIATGDYARAGTPDGRAWREALRLARTLDTDLLPPFEVLESSEGNRAIGTLPVLLMPYGPDAVGGAKGVAVPSHWTPVESQMRSLEEALARAGLVLAEGGTLRAWSGIPFVVDLSDLRATAAARLL